MVQSACLSLVHNTDLLVKESNNNRFNHCGHKKVRLKPPMPIIVENRQKNRHQISQIINFAFVNDKS